MICVDGPAGAGKTTLSGELLSAAGKVGCTAHVVHLDDTYAGWDQDFASLGGRIRNYLVGPLASRHPGRYHRFDWYAGAFTEWVTVPATDVLVVEGVGAGHHNIASRRATLVWVTAPPALCLSRGIARDGEAMREQWLAWKQRESTYFNNARTEGQADFTVVSANVR